MINRPKDIAAGALCVAAGTFFALGALRYRIGSAADMGSGYLPLCLGACLALIGMRMLINAWRSASLPHVSLDWRWRPLLFVTFAVSGFGVLLEPLGVVLASCALCLAAAIFNRPRSWWLAVLLSLLAAAVAWVLFVRLLDIPLPVWPDGMG